ncbi:proprotein convertase P-domain-containing protein [bacterium]|nr:proprotein convertase P-domain-containing protein [bacterium]
MSCVVITIVIAWVLALSAPGPARADVCLGDCVGRAGVGADDLRAGVTAIFDPGAAGVCVAAFDRDPDGRVTAAELVAAVIAAQSGCGESSARCAALAAPLAVPDDDADGVASDLVVADPAAVTTLSVSLRIAHTWVGDLRAVLTHLDSGRAVLLLDRPGEPAEPVGCSADDVDCTLADDAALAAEDQCADTPPALAGRLRPAEPLAAFAGEPLAGTWRLQVADLAPGDSGALQGWCLEAAAAPPATPTHTATAAAPTRTATPTRPAATPTATPSSGASPTPTIPATPTVAASLTPTPTRVPTAPGTATATPTNPPGNLIDLAIGGRVATDVGAVVEVLPGSGQGVVAIAATVGGAAGFTDERGLVVSREYDVVATGAAAAQLSGPLLTLPVDASVIEGPVDPDGFYAETFDAASQQWVAVDGMPRYDAAHGAVTFQAPHLSPYRLRLIASGGPHVFLYGWTAPSGHFRLLFYCRTKEPCQLPADGDPAVLPIYPRADADWAAVGGGHAGDPEVPDYLEDLAQALEDGLAALLAIKTSTGAALFATPSYPLPVVVTHTPDASGDSPLGGPLRINARLSDWNEMRTTAPHELVHVLADQHYTILGAVLNRWYFEAIANLWAARAARLSRAEAVTYYRREMATYLRVPLTQSDEGSYYAAADFLDWLETQVGAPLAADVVAADYTRDIDGLAALLAASHGRTLDSLFFEYARLATVGAYDLKPGYLYQIVPGQLFQVLTPDQRGWRVQFNQFNHSVRALSLRTSIARPGLLVAVAERELHDALRGLTTFSYASQAVGPVADIDAFLEAGLAAGQPVTVKNFGAPMTSGVDATILDQIVVTGEQYRPVGEDPHVFDFYFLEAPQATAPAMGRVTWTFDDRGIPPLGFLQTPYVAGFNVYSRGERVNPDRIDPAARQYENPALVDGCGARVTVEDRYGTEWPDPAALQLAAPSGSALCCGQGTACRLAPCATGGAIPHAWTITGGLLPPGFVLDGTTGEIAGTVGVEEREYTVTLQVRDAAGATADYTATILHCGDFNGFRCTVECLY